MKYWEGTVCQHLSIAVNVSSRQLYSEGFTSFVIGALLKTKVSPGKLQMEISEEHLVPTNQEKTIKETLKKIKRCRYQEIYR